MDFLVDRVGDAEAAVCAHEAEVADVLQIVRRDCLGIRIAAQ